MLYWLMPVIKVQQQYSLSNTKIIAVRSKKCILLTFLHSFLTHNSSGGTVVKEGYAIYYAIKKWRHYLEDVEILLKSDAKSLQNF